MKKVILIGIDGATPELIEKWINEGFLQNFKKIMNGGSYGHLKSTIPPFSAPAWTSIVTGCNPGRHGIYGFESTGTLESHLISSRNRKSKAIWNYLSKIGKKCIIVNVPGTYPPEQISGVMITGLLTPSKDSNFTYPSDTKKRLNENDLGKYELEQLWLEDFSRSQMKKHAPEKLINQINEQMESRLNVSLNLMKEIDWSFTMIVFRGTDSAQHFFFDDKKLLLSCYQKVDSFIGEIIEKYKDALVFIVSDHGFEEIKKIFYPDNLLYNNNLLTPTYDPIESPISKFYALLNKIFFKILRILPKETIKKNKFIKNILFASASKSKLIDFKTTKAFSTADGRGIQISLKNKYEDGIVEEKEYGKICNEISKLLSEIKDPLDGSKIIKNVYRWNEIYGNNAINPPDLIFELNKGVTASEWIRTPSEKMDNKRRNIPFVYRDDPANRTGDHSQYGIFFAYGENIKSKHRIDTISVQDILPTIFTTMGVSSPKDIDGQTKYEIFKNKVSTKDINWEKHIEKKALLTKLEIDKIKQLRKSLKK
jgi:predicted AlkP superfamily phosphohydrolase/phosphomutase